MKKILFLCLSVILLMAISNVDAKAQITTVPTYTVVNSFHPTTDTLSGTDTGRYTKVIPGYYHTALAAQWVHKSGASDTCHCTLQQSVDGTNYVKVVGSTEKKFTTASETFIWDGAAVPWNCNYLRLYCLHYLTGKGAMKVKLQLKK